MSRNYLFRHAIYCSNTNFYNVLHSQASGINIGEYDSNDKAFISNYRDRLHDTILKAVMLHSGNIMNLKAIMALVSCLVLEVPCGLTAAAAACLLMAVQVSVSIK